MSPTDPMCTYHWKRCSPTGKQTSLKCSAYCEKMCEAKFFSDGIPHPSTSLEIVAFIIYRLVWFESLLSSACVKQLFKAIHQINQVITWVTIAVFSDAKMMTRSASVTLIEVHLLRMLQLPVADVHHWCAFWLMPANTIDDYLSIVKWTLHLL